MREPLREAAARARDTTRGFVHQTRPLVVTSDLSDWYPRGSTGWQSGRATKGGADAHAAAVYLYEGSMSFHVTRSTMVDLGNGESERCAFEHLFALYAAECLAIAGEFFSTNAGTSILRCGLGIQGWDGCAAYAVTDARFFQNVPRASDSYYVASQHFAARELAADPRTATGALLEPLLVSFVPDDYDLFGRLSQDGR